MNINFTQGIISYPYAGNLQSFLTPGGGYVSFDAANGSTNVAIAHGSSTYLVSETVSVPNAWGPLQTGVQYWLYWDVNTTTAAVTRGFSTSAPIASSSRPSDVVEGQHWFDTTNRKMYIMQQGQWRAVIRAFAASVIGSVFAPLGAGFPSTPYAGTQAGIFQDNTLAGRIIVDNVGNPIRRSDGRFFTTEDDFFVNGSPISSIRLETGIVTATAGANLAKYQVVKYSEFDTVVAASYNDVESTMIAMVMEDVVFGSTCNVCIQGRIDNPQWNFGTVGVPLWVTTGGALTPNDPHITDALQNPHALAPVARVISPTSVIFDQGLGMRGEPGLGAGDVATTLPELLDVTLTEPQDGQVLTYEGGMWINEDAGSADLMLKMDEEVITWYKEVQVPGDPGWTDVPQLWHFNTTTNDGNDIIFTDEHGLELRIDTLQYRPPSMSDIMRFGRGSLAVPAGCRRNVEFPQLADSSEWTVELWVGMDEYGAWPDPFSLQLLSTVIDGYPIEISAVFQQTYGITSYAIRADNPSTGNFGISSFTTIENWTPIAIQVGASSMAVYARGTAFATFPVTPQESHQLQVVIPGNQSVVGLDLLYDELRITSFLRHYDYETPGVPASSYPISSQEFPAALRVYTKTVVLGATEASEMWGVDAITVNGNPVLSNQTGLDDLSDVYIGSTDDGDVLTYIAGDQTWRPRPQQSGGSLAGFSTRLAVDAPNQFINASVLAASGGTANQDLVLTPKGTGSIAAQRADSTTQGGEKRGARAVDFQMLRETSTQVAQGNGSVIAGGVANHTSGTFAVISGGYRNAAGVSAAVGGGDENTSSGAHSTVAGGYGNAATADTAAVAGGSGNISSGGGAFTYNVENTASGIYSSAHGYRANTRTLTGSTAHASGSFTEPGDAQTMTFVQRVISQDGTPLVINAAGESNPANTSANDFIILSFESFNAFETLISAFEPDTGDGASFKISGAIRRISGNVATLVGTPQVTTLGATSGALSWIVEAVASGPNLLIQVTGQPSKIIRWVGKTTTVESCFISD